MGIGSVDLEFAAGCLAAHNRHGFLTEVSCKLGRGTIRLWPGPVFSAIANPKRDRGRFVNSVYPPEN